MISYTYNLVHLAMACLLYDDCEFEIWLIRELEHFYIDVASPVQYQIWAEWILNRDNFRVAFSPPKAAKSSISKTLVILRRQWITLIRKGMIFKCRWSIINRWTIRICNITNLNNFPQIPSLVTRICTIIATFLLYTMMIRTVP